MVQWLSLNNGNGLYVGNFMDLELESPTMAVLEVVPGLALTKLDQPGSHTWLWWVSLPAGIFCIHNA
ncbi:hypothetical protein GQ457_05G032510 [Hibiscus cannabinus]